jgi:hypothetical protein
MLPPLMQYLLPIIFGTAAPNPVSARRRLLLRQRLRQRQRLSRQSTLTLVRVGGL